MLWRRLKQDIIDRTISLLRIALAIEKSRIE
jgi:hypothetical protein